MRVEAGAIVDEYPGAGGLIVARYQRQGDGQWLATFTVVADNVTDLALVHRLVAPTLADARRAVPHAVALLAGEPVDVADPVVTP